MNCPVCGHRNTEGSRFCSNCGTRLVDVKPGEGERKLVSVLFADVAGSTELTQLLGAEEWAEVMNGAFSVMNEAVAHYGGTVGRLMGDGILAFFGVPTTHEDDPERAVLAALRIRDAAAEYGEQVLGRLGGSDGVGARPFAVRVGVSTGQSVLTTVGDDVRAEFTAMGETANLAARLQGMAEPGSVVIAQDTFDLVQDAFETVPLGAHAVKGLAEPVKVYEVLDPIPGGARRRGIEGLVAPIVGRDRELRALRDRVAALGRGEGTFVSVVGEAGLGKSRLVAEMRARALHDLGRADGGLAWFEGRALSYAQAVPYFPLRGAILASLGATQADPPAAVRERLAGVAAAPDWEGRRHEPYLQLLMAVEDEATVAETRTLDGGVLERRITEAVAALVTRLASRPTVLVFEDMHWADRETVAMLAELAELTARLPLMVVAAMRPDRGAPSYALLDEVTRRLGERHLRLDLTPLDAASSRDLLVQLLGGGELPAPLERVLERSDGNPFYLEEVLRSLIDSGHLVKREGRWSVTGDLSDVEIPETLFGVLSARIDRLPEETRRVAQTAAVIGRSFERRVLGSVLTHDSAPWRVGDVAPHLAKLTYEELVRELEPEEEYAFKHVLTQEAAYDRLLTRRRVELHRLVAQVLERLYEGRLDEVAAALASHYERAEEWTRFAEHASRAADRARRVNAVDKAFELVERAVAALERVETGARDEAWKRAMATALIALTDTELVLRHHEDPEKRQGMIARSGRGVELARELGDERTLVRALVLHANIFVLSGHPTQGFDVLSEADDIARRLGDDELFLLPFWAATEMLVGDDPETAAERLGEVAELAAAVGDKAVRSHALASRAVALARLGRFEEAYEVMPLALEAAYASGSTIKEADVAMLVGAALMDMDELDAALRFIVHGRDKALGMDGRECAANGLWLSGQWNMARRHLQVALEEFDKALQVGAGTAYEPQLYGVEASKAACRFRVGELAAVSDLTAQVERAESMRDAYGRWTAAHLLANALDDLGRFEEAEGHLEGALAWFRDRGMRPYVARALRELARSRRGQGRDDAAAEAEAEAAAIEATLGGPFDLSVLGEPGRPALAMAG